MPRKKKERGRPPSKTLPPRIQATPEQLAQAMFAMPTDHKWKYLEGMGTDYRCGRCENPVGYPEVLSVAGLCRSCETLAKASP